jgi:hemoglobin
MKKPLVIAVLAAAALAGCASMSMKPHAVVPLQDGEVPLPAGYTSWPKFLSAVQRPDAKQVREIYINPTGFNSKAGQPFAHGSTLVMENYSAQLDAAGQPVKDADGKIVKGKLLRVFVMSKGPGFGSAAPAESKNGEWAYASFDASGARTADALGPCRTCHLPQAGRDFVFRYDEYIAARAKNTY